MLKYLSQLLLGGVAYYLGALASISAFALEPGNIALLWLPSGLGLALVLRFGHGMLPIILVASFLANFNGMLRPDEFHWSVFHTFISASSNMAEAGIAAALFRTLLPNGLTSFKYLLPFIFGVCGIASTFNATVLTSNLVYAGYISVGYAWTSWIILILTNTLGMMIVYPLLATVGDRQALSQIEWGRFLTLTFMTLGCTYLGFTLHPGFIYLALLPLVFLATQKYRDSAYLLLAALIAMTIMLARIDLGPFNLETLQNSRLYLLIYLYTVTLLVIGMELSQRDVHSAKKAEDEWRYRANHDALTKLGNRHLFIPQLTHEIHRAERKSRPFALALLDIDYFKQVNDNHGHAAGDKLLQRFAEIIRSTIREIDLPARMGGDEFAILFPETRLADAEIALHRICERVRDLQLHDNREGVDFSVSVGLAEYMPGQGIGSETLLSKVDQRLYQAKRQGRNQICNTDLES